MFKAVPLKSSFMLASILGFLITLIYRKSLGADWGFTLAFTFILMFIASMVSMSRAPLEGQLELNPELRGSLPGLPKKRTAGRKGSARKSNKK